MVDGDIVLRRGCGITSRMVMAADGGSGYSHVGIVAIVEGIPMVVHAVPDEPDHPEDVDRVKIEPIERFFSQANAEAGRILRQHDRTASAKAAKAAMRICKQRTLFDHDYNEDDTARMYCSELVAHAYRCAGKELPGTPRHSISLPGLKLKSVIFPSDFMHIKSVATVSAFAKR